MAPMKRPAAAEAEGPANKKARKEMIDLVADAVKGTALPKDVIALLGKKKMLEECFAVPKEERHPYQEKVIAMLTEVMDTAEGELKASIEEIEKKVAGSDSDKAAKDAAEKAAEEAVAAKKEAMEAAKTAALEATEAVKTAKAASADAESEQKEGDAALEAASGKKEKLEAVLSGTYAGLKAGTLEADKVDEGVTEVEEIAKEFGFDGTLITSLPSALVKPLSERGAFDDMVWKQVEDGLAKHVAAQAELLSNGEASKAARADKVASAKAAVEAAELALTAKKDAKTEAATALKEAESALKEASKAVSGHGKVVKEICSELDGAKEALVDFGEGAKPALAQLVAYTLIVPEAPPEPVAEEAPASEPVPEAPVA